MFSMSTMRFKLVSNPHVRCRIQIGWRRVCFNGACILVFGCRIHFYGLWFLVFKSVSILQLKGGFVVNKIVESAVIANAFLIRFKKITPIGVDLCGNCGEILRLKALIVDT